MSYGSPDTVAVLLGVTLNDTQTRQCQAFLDQAERLIKNRIPDLETRITNGEIDVADIMLVEERAARRIMLNPEGRDNERIDDYSYGLNPNVAASEVFLTDDDWQLLMPSTDNSNAFSIRSAGRPYLASPRLENPRERW